MSKSILFNLLLIPFFTFSQHFKYKKPINTPTKGWYEIVLDKDVYLHASKDLSDLRILGVNANGDTIEAPYILENYVDLANSSTISIKPFNLVTNERGYYATFKVPEKEFIAQCELLFDNNNYDWLIQLEGSNDEQSWFTITDKQRIIKIENEQIHFNHCRLQFEPTNYSYYRIWVKSPSEKPKLASVSITTSQPKQAKISTYSIKPKFKLTEKNKSTYIEVKLPSPIPVNSLSISFQEDFDFYRPATIYYGSVDSTLSDEGIVEHFEKETSAIFTSTNRVPIQLEQTITDRILISIENQDNMPLHIGSLTIIALNYKLITRISKSSNYSLYYGDNNLYFPQYDIVQFKESIPTKLNSTTLSKEESIEQEKIPIGNKPVSKIWLWALMFVLIGVMFFFSIKMLKK
jgi:hypothetical protein